MRRTVEKLALASVPGVMLAMIGAIFGLGVHSNRLVKTVCMLPFFILAFGLTSIFIPAEDR